MSNSPGITLGKINEITTRINSEQEIHSLLKVIMDTARELLHTEGASLLLYDEDTGELVFNVISGDSDQYLHEKRVPAGEGIAGECARDRKPILVADAERDPRVFKGIDRQIGFVTRNLLAVPMIARERLIGVLETVNTEDSRDFTRKDIQLLTYLANMAALAVQSRKHIDDLNVRVDELNCIYDISQSVHKHDRVEDILGEILESIHRILKVDRLSIFIQDEQDFAGQVIHTLGFEISDSEKIDLNTHEGVLGHVYRNGNPLLVRDYRRDLDFVPEFADRYRTRSFLCVPIFRDRRVVGVISAADKLSGSPFDQFELKVLTTVSAQLADSLHRFQSKIRETQLAEYRKDIETAAKIQISSLPVIPPSVAGCTVATRYEACLDVGGDFYDMIYHSDDRISFLIADVAGKGVPAALFMEYSKTLLAGLIPRFMDPVSTLVSANREIYNNTGMSLFVTVMLLQVERDYKRIRLASAGHNNQVLIRAGDHSIVNLAARGTPLGAFDKTEYLERIVDYNPGDTLVLYTDGITEAEGETDLDFFGEERFFDLLIKNADREPGEIVDEVFRTIETFRGEREPSDDTTILVVRLV